MEISRDKDVSAVDGSSGGSGETAQAGRSGSTWRAMAVTIVVAVALSVAATLLLGGNYRFPGGGAGRTHAVGDECCPPKGSGR